MHRTLKLISTLVVVLLLSNTAQAGMIDVVATEDTFITQHGGLGGTSSVHGADNILYVIGDQNSGFIATSFVRFDISSLAGNNVSGDGELKLYLGGAWPNSQVTVSSFVSNSPWDETVSWNTMPGGAPFGSVGAIQDDLVINFTNEGEGYRSWTIDESLIQSWIDNPTANYGLMITSGNASSGHSDIFFSSREADGEGPRLVFSVPVPASLFLMLTALVSGLVLGRRHV